MRENRTTEKLLGLPCLTTNSEITQTDRVSPMEEKKMLVLNYVHAGETKTGSSLEVGGI